MASEAEVEAMARAIQLAARGVGTTTPNPVVGAVVLDAAGAVVGEGFHAVAGGPHAEVEALRIAGERSRGGTCVVTLEPCNHTGRTGACVEALRAAGIARVVYAVADPNPIAGGGAAALANAGIEVERGVLDVEAQRVNEAWLTYIRFGRPFVTWKYAVSLDGRTAAADGSSRWITSAESRRDVHRLRAQSDAVLVGSGTVLADDPHLAVRNGDLMRAQPLRVVLDTRARTPVDARVLDSAAPTLIVVGQAAAAGPEAAALRRAGAEVVAVADPVDGSGLDIGAVLRLLARRELVSVLLEGGAGLAGAFLRAGVIDRVIGYVAPLIIGGDGVSMLAGPGAPNIDSAPRLRLDEVTCIGSDVRLVARPIRSLEV